VSPRRRSRAQPSAVVMLTTAGSRAEANRIAAALVDERLAACVNVVAPITSIYRWRGAVERAEEVLLLVKTRRARMARVGARIRALHSYDLPEVIALPIDAGSAAYLAWIAAVTPLPRRRRRRR
jgi:periplasmic divalent cation tolerance protein